MKTNTIDSGGLETQAMLDIAQQQQQQVSKNGNSGGENRTNLIVNYLPQTMTEEEIRSLFSSVGEVESVKLMRNRFIVFPDPLNPGAPKGQSLGYGFVNYVKAQDAEQAVNVLNGLRLQNKTIKVSFARPSSNAIKGATLYISGLPKTLTEQDLETIFAPYGTIITSHILQNAGNDSHKKGVGFIRYDTRDEAERAIQMINGTTPPGCTEPISVKFSNSSGSNANKSLQTLVSIANLYISGLPKTLTEQDLETIFAPYGTIITSRILQNAGNDSQKKGVGFIRYATLDEAKRAIQAINGTTPPGCTEPISVKFSKTTSLNTNKVLLMPFPTFLAPHFALPSGGAMHNPVNKGLARFSPMAGKMLTDVMIPGANGLTSIAPGGGWSIFVFNLPPETEESTIWRLFGQFGPVQSVKLIKYSTSQCKGYGFVNMTNYELAMMAIHALNGFSLGNRTLQVSFANRQM